MNKKFFYVALCLTLSLGATDVYSQANSGQQKKTTPAATKPAASQQVQQTPKENPLIGKTLESPEFKALKLTYLTHSGLHNEGGKSWNDDVYVYSYSKNGKFHNETVRYFLVNQENSTILDELIWEKKPGILFNQVEIYDSATASVEAQFIKYKVVKQACVILAYYECKDGKFVEKKPKATWVSPEDY